MQVCRICLDTERKLYDLNANNLDKLYKQLTNITSKNDKLPQKLCWECTHRLLNYNKFRDKALKAQKLMMTKLLISPYLTEYSIISIDRIRNDLASSFIGISIDVNYNDLHLYDTSVPSPVPSPYLDRNFKIKCETDTVENVNNDELDTIGEFNEKFDENNDEFDGNNDEVDGYNDDFCENNDDFDGNNDGVDGNNDDVDENNEDKDEINDNNSIHSTSSGYKEHATVSECTTKNALGIPKNPEIHSGYARKYLIDTFKIVSNLSLEEQIEEIQKRKDSYNYTTSDYHCDDCFKGFINEGTLNNHLFRHTDQCGPHKCEVCKVRFKKRVTLRTHALAHSQKFICKNCPFVTTSTRTAYLHRAFHKGVTYECPQCSALFSKLSSYLSHLRIKHPSDFICALCGNSFISSKGLSQHKNLKHRFDGLTVPADGPYCEECDIRFASIDALQTHINESARHKSVKVVKENSGVRRVRGYTEGNKKKKRKIIGPFPCELCDMQLPNAKAYHGHFRSAHPGKNRTKYHTTKAKYMSMCEVCGRMFGCEALLRDHISLHKDEQFQCAHCNKFFKQRSSLYAHERLHDPVRYPCPTCGKQFSSLGNMRRHTLIHTGEKPFMCEMCGKRFCQHTEKKQHVRCFHLKQPWPKRNRRSRPADSRQPKPASADDAQPSPDSSEPETQSNEESVYYLEIQ